MAQLSGETGLISPGTAEPQLGSETLISYLQGDHSLSIFAGAGLSRD